MSNVIHPNFKRSAPFIANVIFDAQFGMWMVSCDALHSMTEAASYAALTERFCRVGN